jgi:ubiquinone/menaquinone biosynthesis C-methylase UbiE
MLNLQIDPEVERPSQQASPAIVFETLQRYQQTMALKGAIDLELFTHIANGADTPDAIAACCRANERGVRILCDFLTIIGFLRKTDGVYDLTRESALFLDKASPNYVGSITGFLTSPAILGRFRDVAALVRQGGPPDNAMVPENDLWVEFAKSMAPVVILAAQRAAAIIGEPGRRIRVLDIAAGHGMFGIAVARHNPAAEIVALDWKKVLDVAIENAAKAGVQDRFHTIPGDVFEVDLGNGYDLVMIPNFLHHFDAATNVRLLKRIRTVMNPGGRLAAIEFVPNDDRISPPAPAAFSMNMLGATQHGDAYTFREFEQMFRSAGFGESRLQLLEPSPQALVLTSR